MSETFTAQSFPTPMEEPKKVMRVQYCGVMQVERPSGMEILNSAIDRVVEANPPPWRNVSVAVAPSTVTVTNTVSLLLPLPRLHAPPGHVHLFITALT